MKILTATAIIIGTIMFISCATTSVDFMRYVDENYPMTDSIDVLRAKPLEGDFIELGELSVRTQENAILLLKEKAKEIGANAIIILGEDTKGSVIVPIGNLYASVNRKYIKAIAIKYKQ